ncbi:TetR/AcrR family transcriptional regulator [Nocardiopsis sp. NPDC055879]
MNDHTRRTPTGAAVLRPHVTSAISEAVLDELAERGYGRLSMEGVAKRAGTGKSSLYRRWSSKQGMVISALTEFSVPPAEIADTGSFEGDLRATLEAVYVWLTHPRFAAILPDLAAEAGRDPELVQAIESAIGVRRRALGEATLRRAIERGELPEDTHVPLALDLMAAPLYWRLNILRAEVDPDYLNALVTYLLRALNAR